MTALLSTAIPLIGLALCAMALLQLALWSTQSLSMLAQNRRQFELNQSLLREKIADANKSRFQTGKEDMNWKGYRSFHVSKIERESSNVVSVYLRASDQKPIPSFHPGQHITLQLNLPGHAKPTIRCFSLSDRPGRETYRISVKNVAESGETRRDSGASQYINESLKVGDTIDVKAPSGRFVLDESSHAPIVMLGGGIGITPLISMVKHLANTKAQRQVLLIHGVRNSKEHSFKSALEQLANDHEFFHLVNFYSNPLPEDRDGTDFHAKGWITIDILKQILPNHRFQFYLCGPPPFMKSLLDGLQAWGVPNSNIRYEAFGPASIQKSLKQNSPRSTQAKDATVIFGKSQVVTQWASDCDSILGLAEANEVSIESGCGAGSCGTCATKIVSGDVLYSNDEHIDCEPGHCLVCIAQPNGPLELDA